MPFFFLLFSLFFFSFSSFFLSLFFPLLFVVLPLPCSFFVRFVLSCCRFLFASCMAFFDYIFASSLISSVADYVILLNNFVSALHLPRAPCEPEVCVFPLRAVFLALLTYFYFSFSSFPFSISIWTSFVSSRLFFAGTMLSPRLRFLLPLV